MQIPSQSTIILFAAATSVSAVGFILLSFAWMRKLRENVSIALAEAANQQIRNAQRMNDTLEQVQKQQRNYEQQLQLLAQANSQLRQGLVNMATRLEHQTDSARSDHTIH